MILEPLITFGSATRDNNYLNKTCYLYLFLIKSILYLIDFIINIVLRFVKAITIVQRTPSEKRYPFFANCHYANAKKNRVESVLKRRNFF